MALMGKTATGYKIIAVTDEGELYALLQGMTPEDELRTIRLDDEGRISAFVIDSLDAWDRLLTIGNAELAVRMGSMVSYDRRGQVQFIEDFENGLGGWPVTESGDFAEVKPSPLYFCRGGYALQLKAGKTAPQQAGVAVQRGEMVGGRMGVEVAFSIKTSLETFSVGWAWYTGTQLHMARATYDHTTGEIQVLDHGGGNPPIADVTLPEDTPYLFHRFKVVADLDDLQYVRVMLDNQEIDASAHAMWSDGIVTAPYVVLEALLTGRLGQNDFVYIDDLIYTVAEP